MSDEVSLAPPSQPRASVFFLILLFLLLFKGYNRVHILKEKETKKKEPPIVI